MITAVDTSVLLDVLGADPQFGLTSKAALEACLIEGSLIACEVVWSEVSSQFSASAQAEETMGRLRVEFSATDLATALSAGRAWRAYRERRGRRQRLMADFLIGAHAALNADRLLSRDRGFYRNYFKRLTVLDPTA